MIIIIENESPNYPGLSHIIILKVLAAISLNFKNTFVNVGKVSKHILAYILCVFQDKTVTFIFEVKEV